jgi:hypothetical protein
MTAHVRRNHPVENDRFAAMLRRMLRAMGRRAVTDGDLDALADMVAIHDEMAALIGDTVEGLRVDRGYSWADIGRAAGVSRQAAQQRWGRPAAQDPGCPPAPVRLSTAD